MDGNMLMPGELASLLRTSKLFLQICSHQHIFITLFEYIGFQAFVSLSSVNSKVHSAVNNHEGIQVQLLRLRIKKLKQKEFKRDFPIFSRVDFNFFNPYTLPPYEKEASLNQTLDQIARENALIKAQNLQNQISSKREWGKWRAAKKASAILGSNSSIGSKSEGRETAIQVPKESSYDEKIRIIKEAEQFYNIKMQMKKKVQEEYPVTNNPFEDMRNRHFAQKILGKQQKAASKPKVGLTKRQKDSPSALQSPRGQKNDAWHASIQKLVKQEIKKKNEREVPGWVEPRGATFTERIVNNLFTFIWPGQN